MKLKKIFAVILLGLCLVLMFSGCANSTYVLKLKKNGNMDVTYTLLFDSAGLSEEDTEHLNKYTDIIKQKFTDIGYTVKEKSDLGLSGFIITKVDIPQVGDGFVDDVAYNIDILDDIMYHMDYDEKARCNTYEIDTDIDMISFGNIPDELKGKVTAEEYTKILSRMNLKLVIELEDGAISESNATNITKDKRRAEWVIIPGSTNPVKMNAVMGVNTAWISSMIIVAVVVLLAIIFMTIFSRMYKKKNS